MTHDDLEELKYKLDIHTAQTVLGDREIDKRRLRPLLTRLDGYPALDDVRLFLEDLLRLLEAETR